MALPELTAEQKFTIREIQLNIANASIDINSIQQKANTDITAAQKRQNTETIRLRAFIEELAKNGNVDVNKASFDLDALKFNEIAPTPPLPVSTILEYLPGTKKTKKTPAAQPTDSTAPATA